MERKGRRASDKCDGHLIDDTFFFNFEKTGNGF